MANRSHVPKFGNWENEGNVPYTAYFDKARKGRTGVKMINPNDPEENPDFLSDDHSSQADSSLGTGKPGGVVAVKPVVEHNTGTRRYSHESERSKDEGDMRQFTSSPANNPNNARRGGGTDTSSQQRPGAGAGRGVQASGEGQRRPSRQSLGSENSIEKSPLHRHAKASTGRDSPSWEGRNSSHEGSHGTPGRSRLKPRGDETPDRGAAVPKFGEWDETNPASADGFTHIFNKVREERQIGAGRVGTPEPSYANKHKPARDDSSKGCCFSFFGK